MLIDLHCHMLPGIDDGAKTLDQALAMARIAVGDGIRTIVLTPHHLNGVYVNPATLILERVTRFREALLAAGIGLKVLPGSELHLVPELPDELAAARAMTLANQGRAALVELPVHTIPVGSEHLLEQILCQGLTPIIAHPERNSLLCRQPDRLAEWVEMGCLAQITAQSCLGKFGPIVREAARDMIQRGLIHVVASDAHRDQRRIPELSKGRAQIAEWTNPATAELMAERFPLDLIEGRLPDRVQLERMLPPQRSAWWRRMVHWGSA